MDNKVREIIKHMNGNVRTREESTGWKETFRRFMMMLFSHTFRGTGMLGDGDEPVLGDAEKTGFGDAERKDEEGGDIDEGVPDL